jgi:hypothetical protein
MPSVQLASWQGDLHYADAKQAREAGPAQGQARRRPPPENYRGASAPARIARPGQILLT